MRYSAGTLKGGVTIGQEFNSVYRLGEMNEDRMRYTSSAIRETGTVAVSADLQWGYVSGIAKLVVTTTDGASTTYRNIQPVFANAAPEGYPAVSKAFTTPATTAQTYTIKSDDGNSTIATVAPVANSVNGEYTIAFENPVATSTYELFYFYNNIEIPQDKTPTSLPTLKAEMTSIALTAKARRIAIYYSQMAA